MDKKKIIKEIAAYLEKEFSNKESGHDWWHIYRVWQLSKKIGAKEGGDIFVIELGALLHDIADWKFHAGDDTLGSKIAQKILRARKVDQNIIDKVCAIVDKISFKGALVKDKMKSREGKIVQDADRLDAMGAIGVARAFSYGGHKNRPMYDPKIKAVMAKNKKQYYNSGAATINHFYEKLLLLKERMNTKTGKKLALGRHKYMEKYLDRFFKEWKGAA